MAILTRGPDLDLEVGEVSPHFVTQEWGSVCHENGRVQIGFSSSKLVRRGERCVLVGCVVVLGVWQCLKCWNYLLLTSLAMAKVRNDPFYKINLKEPSSTLKIVHIIYLGWLSWYCEKLHSISFTMSTKGTKEHKLWPILPVIANDLSKNHPKVQRPWLPLTITHVIKFAWTSYEIYAVSFFSRKLSQVTSEVEAMAVKRLLVSKSSC